MLESKVVLVFILSLVGVLSSRYESFSLIEIGPLNSKLEADFIMSLLDKDDHTRQVVMLNEHVVINGKVDLVVGPKNFLKILTELKKESIPFNVLNNNFQKLINEQVANRAGAKAETEFGKFKHDAYLTYNEQMSWLSSLASKKLPAPTRLFSIGKSYEGRNLQLLAINEQNTSLPVIYVDSGMHAREWLSPATNMYMIEEILTGTTNDAVTMRTKYRWYFFLNVNPDGYVYTWSNDRLWRKTRSLNPGSTCVGTDPNRNWDANWSGEGASGDPCSDTYYGRSAFSEIEIKSESNFLKTISGTCNFFMSIHAYTQLWLFPWGAYSYHSNDYDELMRVAQLAVSAVKSVNGLNFTPGTPADLLYVASGGSMDWTKQSNNMQYGYAPELRPATAAQGGFVVSPTNIVPSGKEILAGLVACVKNAKHKL